MVVDDVVSQCWRRYPVGVVVVASAAYGAGVLGGGGGLAGHGHRQRRRRRLRTRRPTWTGSRLLDALPVSDVTAVVPGDGRSGRVAADGVED